MRNDKEYKEKVYRQVEECVKFLNENQDLNWHEVLDELNIKRGISPACIVYAQDVVLGKKEMPTFLLR